MSVSIYTLYKNTATKGHMREKSCLVVSLVPAFNNTSTFQSYNFLIQLFKYRKASGVSVSCSYVLDAVSYLI